MDKQAIILELQARHQAFIDEILLLDEAAFMHSPNGKWTAGQQLDHIRRSIGPVALAFGLPSFVLRLFFGKTNRPSKTYEALVEKYKGKLATGGKAPSPFVPKMIYYIQRGYLSRQLQTLVIRLSRAIERKSESELDTLILPHPLLGKLTLREMLFFTIYHVQHHHKQIGE